MAVVRDHRRVLGLVEVRPVGDHVRAESADIAEMPSTSLRNAGSSTVELFDWTITISVSRCGPRRRSSMSARACFDSGFVVTSASVVSALLNNVAARTMPITRRPVQPTMTRHGWRALIRARCSVERNRMLSPSIADGLIQSYRPGTIRASGSSAEIEDSRIINLKSPNLLTTAVREPPRCGGRFACALRCSTRRTNDASRDRQCEPARVGELGMGVGGPETADVGHRRAVLQACAA